MSKPPLPDQVIPGYPRAAAEKFPDGAACKAEYSELG